MAYPGFQRGDANSILPNVLINHMKMKKIGPGGVQNFTVYIRHWWVWNLKTLTTVIYLSFPLCDLGPVYTECQRGVCDVGREHRFDYLLTDFSIHQASCSKNGFQS